MSKPVGAPAGRCPTRRPPAGAEGRGQHRALSRPPAGAIDLDRAVGGAVGLHHVRRGQVRPRGPAARAGTPPLAVLGVGALGHRDRSPARQRSPGPVSWRYALAPHAARTSGRRRSRSGSGTGRRLPGKLIVPTRGPLRPLRARYTTTWRAWPVETAAAACVTRWHGAWPPRSMSSENAQRRDAPAVRGHGLCEHRVVHHHEAGHAVDLVLAEPGIGDRAWRTPRWRATTRCGRSAW